MVMDIIIIHRMVHQNQQMDIIIKHHHHYPHHRHHHHHHHQTVHHQPVNHQHHQPHTAMPVIIVKCTITQAWPIIKQLQLQQHQMANHGNRQPRLVTHQYHLLKPHKQNINNNLINSDPFS